MNSDFETKLSSASSKRLFENGDASLFESFAKESLPEKPELAPEAVYKDPFEHLKEREDLLNTIRLQLAVDIKDPRQVLKTKPSLVIKRSEPIASSSSFMNRYNSSKSLSSKENNVTPNK